VYKENWVNQRMPMFLLGWYPDYFDTDDYISPFMGIAGAKSEGSFYNNSQVDQWVRDEASTSDPNVRADRFTKIQAALAEDVPYVPLFSAPAQAVYVNGVQNVELHPVSFKWFIINKPGATQLNASTSDHIINLDGSAAFLLYDVGALRADHLPGDSAPGVIDTPDATTVVFHLFSPVSFFNQLMAFSVSAPVPWTYNQNGLQPSTAGSVIGTGPYVLTTHVPDQLVVLDKNLAYYNPNLYQSEGIGPIPKMDRVVINIKSTDAALKQDIETKAVDVAFRTISPVDLADLEDRQASLGLTVKHGSSPQIRFLVFNVNLVPNKAV